MNTHGHEYEEADFAQESGEWKRYEMPSQIFRVNSRMLAEAARVRVVVTQFSFVQLAANFLIK